MSKTTVYTMINLETFKEKSDRKNIVDYIQGLDNVLEVYEVYGPYDAIVKIESDDLDKVKKTVDSIRGKDGVYSSETSFCLQ